MKFDFIESKNQSGLQLLNTSGMIKDRRMKVTFFKESGKYYDSVEFEIKLDEDSNDPQKENYELVTQTVEFIKNFDSYRNMHAVINFQDNDHGYPLMILASERK